MIEFFKKLFESDFMPHGHCYFWRPEILWPHAISDSIIAMAYFAIPFVLIYIFKKRPDFKFVWMAVLFAVFIFGCGLTHVFDVINIWEPYYRADSVVRVATALASIGTAFVLSKATPKILRIPTEEQWISVNRELKEKITNLEEKDKVIEAIRQFEKLTEAVPQIMWTNDKEGRVIFMNSKWAEYTGRPAKQVAGARLIVDWALFIHPDDYPLVLQQWGRALLQEEKFESEFRLKNQGGHYEWFLCRCLPVNREESGLKWFGALTNVHEQKRHMEDLKKTNYDLDNFVYAASHDLRTPITNMMSIMNLLKGESAGEMLTQERGKKLIDMCERSVEKLRTVVDDLTEVSKLQKRRDDEDEAQKVNLPGFLQEILEELRSQIAGTSATISSDFGVEEILFSRKNIRSILINLLSNALKYASPERKPEISIRTYRRDPYVALEVQDNGIGIDRKNHEKVFELFTRLHRDDKGAGVGLFIVKRIVDNAEGKIEIVSEPGKGSVFKIFLKE